MPIGRSLKSVHFEIKYYLNLQDLMKKIKVVQILPYFPPHTWWLEMVAQNISKYLVSHTDTDVINITSDIGQKKKWYNSYQEDGYEVICLPSFNIVHHFPCYKFWDKSFWQVLKKIKKYKPDIIQTHTRFFLQTFLGGILSKFWWAKWVHVEHGSGFVTWIVWWKKLCARLYDQILGRLIFLWANKIISINKVNLEFIKRFTKLSKCEIIYNWINFPKETIKKLNVKTKIVYIGRLTTLKWVHILLETIKNLKDKWIYNFDLDIIWDGEEMKNLADYIKSHKLSNVKLLWKKSHDDIVNAILPQTDILVNPSFQEWLPTTVLEWLVAKCVVVATDVGGTKEISDLDDLILVKAGESVSLENGLNLAIKNYEKLKWVSYNDIKEKFNWENSVENYFSIYKSF